MAIADGKYPLGPQSGRLLVKTARTGMGAMAGHDLTIEVTRWHGTASVASADPAASSVEVTAEVASFEVREGTGGVKPLTSGDRAEIKRTLMGKILEAGRYPEITFASTKVSGGPDAFRIDGNLTIKGATRPVIVRGQLTGERVQGSAAVTQSQWGIKPYSAFFGALKLRDEVEVEFDLTLAPGN
jgi:polyisoprenoid-binding protein YceI